MAIAELFWVDAELKGKLAVAPRPRGGDWLEDEIVSWKDAGVNVVVCLLCDDEIAELALSEEAALCGKYSLEFLRYPIVDRGLPQSMESARGFVKELNARLGDGKAVLIHCRAGIARTGLIAACCLSALGADEAFKRIAEARGTRVPDTDQQREWVRDFVYSSNSKSIR